jgi:hypothetical protein
MLDAPDLPIRDFRTRTERAHRTSPPERRRARPIGTSVCAVAIGTAHPDVEPSSDLRFSATRDVKDREHH